jgi:CBS domain-containing protein
VAVTEILREKGYVVHCIAPDETVFDAIAKMVELNIGALIVAAAGVPCGMFTERDYLRRVALRGRSSKTTLVREIMSPSIVSVGPSISVDECMAVMTERRIRHLPVIDDGDLIGIVSIGDIVKHKLREQTDQIRDLTDYIQGAASGMYAR